jgi:hypothetical protein
LTYDDFRRLALDPSLSRYEKIGFPNSYREGKEEAIFKDIMSKVSALSFRNKTVLEIGPGCSGLAYMLIDQCGRQGDELVLIDSAEMLSQLPDPPFVTKVAACFPRCESLLSDYAGKIDAVLAYSVAHYVFIDGGIFDFVDRAMSLLAPGGEFLIGDVPNVSKRKRFFGSAAGIRYHCEFVGREERPEVVFNQLEPSKIDDAVIVGLLLRARLAGCDAYVLPQGIELPMANRREDILIRKP